MKVNFSKYVFTWLLSKYNNFVVLAEVSSLIKASCKKHFVNILVYIIGPQKTFSAEKSYV